MFGVSPRPLTTSPFSVSAVCLLRLLLPCSSVTFWATTTPLALRHGPVPMRSRALTAAPPARLRAQVGAPGLVAGAGGGGERAAEPVGAGEPAEVGAATRARARDEEAHVRRRDEPPDDDHPAGAGGEHAAVAAARTRRRRGASGKTSASLAIPCWLRGVRARSARRGERRGQTSGNDRRLQAALPDGAAAARESSRAPCDPCACHRAARSSPRSALPAPARRCAQRRRAGGAGRWRTGGAPLPGRLRRASGERASNGGTSPARSTRASASVGLPDHVLSRRRRGSAAPSRAASRRASCCSRMPRSATSRREAAPRPAHRAQRLRHRRGERSPTPRSSSATGA